MQDKLKIQRISKNAILPKRTTDGAAGFDLFACINEEIEIKPREIVKIPTGIALGLEDKNVVALIYARSGISIKFGINLANGVGVVDSDYRGEIIVGLTNISNVSYTIKPNDRIAQMVLAPVIIPEILEVSSLDETNRGSGGFGSTGK